MAIDPKYKPIFTLVGLSKIANAINSGVKIELFKMALGDANGVDYTPTESMTALTHEVVRFNLRTLWYENITSTNKTILKFTGILEPGVISSKTVREVGVYDKAGDLIIIFRIPDRPILTDGNIATILDLTFGITLATNSNVFMTLGDTTGNFVTLTEYNGHVNNLNNPHNVNKTQIGLPLADNTRDIDKVVASAGKLTTVRTINGTNFDGTANVIVPINVTAKSDNINYTLPFISGAAGNQSTYIDSDGNLTYNPSTNTLSSANFTGSLNGNATTVSKLLLSDSANPVVGPDSTTKNTIGYVNGLSVLGQIDGALHSQVHSALWEHQIFGDYRTGAMATRGKNNGVWQPWKTVAYLDSSITGNAATATKLQTARTITLSGDISSSVSFDGSANVTLNTTLPNIVPAGTYRSVTVNAKGLVTAGTNPTTLNGYGITDAVTASRAAATFDAAANTWYRIATSAVDIQKNSGVFAIDWSRSGQHGTVRFSADCTYGNTTDGVSIMQLNYSKFGNAPISEARIVYNTAYTANYAYLEVKFAGVASGVSVNVELQDALGWSLITPSTAGSIPANYISHSLTFVPSSKIVPGTFPKVTFNQEGRVTAGAPLLVSDVPLLNQDTTGNAATATGAKNQTAGTGVTCAEKFNNTPAHSTSFSECNNIADAPNTGWWLIYSIRHSNSSNYWGTQIAYGFSNNANQIWQRNIDNGTWSAWTRVDVSGANISELVNNVGYITTEGRAYPRRVGGVDMNFNWSGQGGQPNWLWGGNDGTNHFVYNPSNFNVNYANTCWRANDLGNHQWDSKSTNGYIRLSTGLIIQWGEFNANNSNMVGAPQVINLPVAFANALVYAGVSEDGAYSHMGETAAMDWSTPGKTTLSTIGVYTNYYGVVKFIAIGY